MRNRCTQVRTARGQVARRAAGTPVGRTAATRRPMRRAAGAPVGRTARGQATRNGRARWTHGQRTSLRPLRDAASRSGQSVRLAYEWCAAGRAIALAKRVDRSALGWWSFRGTNAALASTPVMAVDNASRVRPGERLARTATLRRAKAGGLSSGRASNGLCRCASLALWPCVQRALPLRVACPLAVRPTGVPPARRMGRRVAAVRSTGVPPATLTRPLLRLRARRGACASSAAPPTPRAPVAPAA